jgi:hypothetical protein
MSQNKIKRRNRYVFFCGLSVFLGFLLAVKAAEIQDESDSTRTSGFSSSNYALIIGIGSYKNWPLLSRSYKDSTMVGNQLQDMGFAVTYLWDAKSIIQ